VPQADEGSPSWQKAPATIRRRPTPMSRSVVRSITIYCSAVVLTLLLVRHLRGLGGPYFEIPETIYDRVQGAPHLSRQAIVMSRHAAPLMPRGSSLTVIAPAPDMSFDGNNFDVTLYMTADAQLPYHRVLHPSLAEGESWPDFVIALGRPLHHRGYRLVREFPEGRLYAAIR
jgi:hypothetical protein